MHNWPIHSLKEFYNNRYDKHGNDIKSVGWGSVESQKLRFKILSEIADLSSAKICDVGCGFGDLYPYLNKRFKNIKYVGIDISEKLIRQGQTCYPDVHFFLEDILQSKREKEFDYVLASGMLSYRMNNHLEYVEAMLTGMLKMAKRGVAVNFLSSYVDYRLDKNFHFAPEEAFALGKRLARYVTIRHDYPLYEFTLYLYHEARS